MPNPLIVPANPRYTVICAWCKVVLEQGPPDAKISHGICATCLDNVK